MNYYQTFAPGTAARKEHLRDEQEFLSLARASKPGNQCKLRAVSFVKAIGSENEHPGYASEQSGSEHLVQLIKAIEEGACAKDTMVIIAYDEFGGQWDHVSPPGQGNTQGVYDEWGPGTRIPSLILAPVLKRSFGVDHTPHDTTSILATLEHRFGLKPLTSRDARVNDLSSALQ